MSMRHEFIDLINVEIESEKVSSRTLLEKEILMLEKYFPKILSRY